MKKEIDTVAQIHGYFGIGRPFQRYSYRRRSTVSPCLAFNAQYIAGIGIRTVVLLFIDIDEFEAEWVKFLTYLRIRPNFLDDRPFGMDIYNIEEIPLPPYMNTRPNIVEYREWHDWLEIVFNFPPEAPVTLDELISSILDNHIMQKPLNQWLLNPRKLHALTIWLQEKYGMLVKIDLSTLRFHPADSYTEIDMDDWARYIGKTRNGGLQ
jgi:hypothetical protein